MENGDSSHGCPATLLAPMNSVKTYAILLIVSQWILISKVGGLKPPAIEVSLLSSDRFFIYAKMQNKAWRREYYFHFLNKGTKGERRINNVFKAVLLVALLAKV